MTGRKSLEELGFSPKWASKDSPVYRRGWTVGVTNNSSAPLPEEKPDNPDEKSDKET
jgi:hypothetical protein